MIGAECFARGYAWRASHFLLLRQKKVSKEKATPGYAPGCAGFPARLEIGGGCGTRAAPSNSPRPFSAAFSVARRATWGPKGGDEPKWAGKTACCGQPRKNTKNKKPASPRLVTASPGPLRGAEQRRNAGGFRLALSEPQASLASRPAFRVAQGTGRSPAPTQGSPFLWLLSFGEAKESTPARKAEPHANYEAKITKSC